MQSTYFCQISKVFLLECVIVFVNAEKLLITSITFLASAFGKDWILLILIASVITLYNIVRFRQMSNLFTTLFQDIAIKKNTRKRIPCVKVFNAKNSRKTLFILQKVELKDICHHCLAIKLRYFCLHSPDV